MSNGASRRRHGCFVIFSSISVGAGLSSDRAHIPASMLRSYERRSRIARRAMDIVGTVERYDEWACSGTSGSFTPLWTNFLPSTRMNVLATSRPKSQGETYVDLVSDLGGKAGAMPYWSKTTSICDYIKWPTLCSAAVSPLNKGWRFHCGVPIKEAQQTSLGQRRKLKSLVSQPFADLFGYQLRRAVLAPIDIICSGAIASKQIAAA